ncbi:MAG: fibronectin type III domain-containing protein, partial [Eubacterium sp.]|nr:fibronectin type III domain-containing protein [Eubacterium sp.]
GTHCSTCGAIITPQRIIAKTGHTYKQSVTPAAIGKDGKIVKKCSVCGATVTSSIAKISSVSLSAVNYTYNGGVKTPSVTVKDSKGKKLSKGKDYTVSYSSGRKNVGRYAVKIKLKGNYSGTVTKTFDIVPKGTSIKKISASKKSFKVYWKAQKKNTTGYEIQYSTAKSFKNAKTVKVSKNSATSQSVAKLSGKKKYFVRVRTYKTVKFNGKKCKVCSSWSTPKTVVTKK